MRPNEIGQLAYIDHDNFDGFLNLMNPLFLICDILDKDTVKVILLAKNIPLTDEQPFSGISSFQHEYYFDGIPLDENFIYANSLCISEFFRNSLTVFESTSKMLEDMFIPFPIQAGCHLSIQSRLDDFMNNIVLKFNTKE